MKQAGPKRQESARANDHHVFLGTLPVLTISKSSMIHVTYRAGFMMFLWKELDYVKARSKQVQSFHDCYFSCVLHWFVLQQWLSHHRSPRRWLTDCGISKCPHRSRENAMRNTPRNQMRSAVVRKTFRPSFSAFAMVRLHSNLVRVIVFSSSGIVAGFPANSHRRPKFQGSSKGCAGT